MDPQLAALLQSLGLNTAPGVPMMAPPQSTVPMPQPTMTQPAMAPPVTPPSLGASLDPAANNATWLRAQDTAQDAAQDANDPVAAAADPTGASGLLKTLQGVQMPKPPDAQRVGTPHAPTLTKIAQGSGLADLLASLGIGPQQALPGLRLPSTLGQALGGR